MWILLGETERAVIQQSELWRAHKTEVPGLTPWRSAICQGTDSQSPESEKGTFDPWQNQRQGEDCWVLYLSWLQYIRWGRNWLACLLCVSSYQIQIVTFFSAQRFCVCSCGCESRWDVLCFWLACYFKTHFACQYQTGEKTMVRLEQYSLHTICYWRNFWFLPALPVSPMLPLPPGSLCKLPVPLYPSPAICTWTLGVNHANCYSDIMFECYSALSLKMFRKQKKKWHGMGSRKWHPRRWRRNSTEKVM